MKPEELKILDLLCDMGIDAKGNRNLQPWKAYDIDEVNLVIKGLQAENELLKKELEQTEANNELQGKSLVAHSELITKFRKANEQLKTDLEKKQQELTGERELRITIDTENTKLRYALARLRWAHALDMEIMLDALYANRPSSWRFYHKSKVYWYCKCQELKKKLAEA